VFTARLFEIMGAGILLDEPSLLVIAKIDVERSFQLFRLRIPVMKYGLNYMPLVVDCLLCGIRPISRLIGRNNIDRLAIS